MGDGLKGQGLDLKALADAFIKSANRSRFIIVVIVFTSIIAFTAYWNSRMESWNDARLKVVTYVLTHRIYDIEAKRLSGGPDKGDLTEFSNEPSNDRLSTVDNETSVRLYGLSTDPDMELSIDPIETALGPHEWSKMAVWGIDTVSKDLHFVISQSKAKLRVYRDALQLCNYLGLHTRNGVELYWSELQKIRIRRVVYIPVDVFGITLDVNDLGLLGGFAFIIIMLWLRQSLSREHSGLYMVLSEARGNDRRLSLCYQYLAVQQVLTVPLSIPGLARERERRLWNTLHKFLFALPFTVHFVIWINDINTRWIGEINNQGMARLSLYVSLLFLLINAIITIQCLLVASDTDREWDKAAWEIRHAAERRGKDAALDEQ